MRLYSGSTSQFIDDSMMNRIADKLKTSFFDQMGFNPSPAEISSWRNSLRAMTQVVQYAGLDDHGVMLEYQLPLTSKRLDCLFSGHDSEACPSAVIVELKQWEACKPSDCDNEVVTFVGGANRDVLHPAVQVGQYQQYLQDSHTAFYDGPEPIQLSACSYLHNYRFREHDPLLAEKFQVRLERNPLYSSQDVPQLGEYLQKHLGAGDGLEVLARIEESRYRPSKKLMDHVSNVIKGISEYVLLDEQQVVYDRVFTCARSSFHDDSKVVIVVKGGPGTGKSVIAINLMADLLEKGYNAQYATGSRAFTETLRKIIGSRGSGQFKYFNSYMGAETNVVDVLICDEAHRIRKVSHNRYTPASLRTDLPQIQELINASKVAVFFIDDHQIVRPEEIGSVEFIEATVAESGIPYHEYELDAQFRCSGSDAFVNWVNHTLGIRRTANPIWTGEDGFDFRIMKSPDELEAAIRKQLNEGHTARMTAGFCWKWSNPLSDGTLVSDVEIGGYKRPWNAKPDSGRLAGGIPKSNLWAYDPNGIDQVGCIYTAQGFEFDYVGVIFGPDLVYRIESGEWTGDKSHSHDTVVKRSGDKFTNLVKNTYRVLLTRGMKGCYVHFMDRETELFFRSRMEKMSHNPAILMAAEPRSEYDS